MPFKIHPAIGVARVGDAPDEFFIGPESEDELIEPPGGFKDSQCRMKRQAVRFYIYEYDSAGNPVGEVTSQISNITWRFTPFCGKGRSADETFVPTNVQVSGSLDRATFSFTIGTPPDVVPAGELRTDDEGRLVFLGGLGVAAPIPGEMASPPLTGESNRWYDDICEGPIRATFTHDGDPHEIYAWVVVAPPRSSPHVVPTETFYDQMVQAAIDAGRTVHAATPGSPYALDKAQLHFVWGYDTGPGLGNYIELSGATLSASRFEATDPLRVRSTFSSSFFTNSLPNPWHADAFDCGWTGVWSQGGFDDTEDMRVNWARQGIRIQRDGSEIVTERCNSSLMITLLTTSIQFGEVPAGPGDMARTALRAIEFEVISTMAGITLEYDSLPASPFEAVGTPPGPVGPTGGTTVRVRFWIRYTTQTPGPTEHATNVVIRHAGTMTTWTIPVRATSGTRRFTATALVLDRSGSMGELAGDGVTQKHQLLREAAKRFLDVALEGDSIQLVRYDDTAEAVPAADTTPPDVVSGSEVTALTTGTRSVLRNIVDGPDFGPDGSTSIGAGILRGRARLNAVTAAGTEKAMLILTDGVENTSPFVSDVASSVDATTYAIGLGTPQNTSAPVLQALSGNHGGYLLVTGGITAENQFLLDKYFLQVLSGINKSEVVLDPQGELALGVEQAIPFRITESDTGFEAILVTTLPGIVDYRLLSPRGKVLEPWRALADPTIDFRLTSGVSFFRIALPAEIAAGTFEQAGTWTALLKIGRPRTTRDLAADAVPDLQAEASRSFSLPVARDRQSLRARTHLSAMHAHKQGRLPFTFLVHSYSSVALRASLRQTGFDPGSSVVLSATLLDSGALPLPKTRVTAQVTRPDGSRLELELSRIAADSGRYEATFGAVAPGVYRCRVLATAESAKGHPFTREQTLTAQVWHGGNRAAENPLSSASDGDRHDLVCDLLRCLTGERGALSPELLRKLADLGIDVAHFRRCLDRLCKERRASATEVSRALELAAKNRGGG